MSYSSNNTIGYDQKDSQFSEWTIYLSITQAINAILLGLMVWILGSVVGYGISRRIFTLKTKRGKLHIACTAAMITLCPRLLLNQVYFHLPDLPNALEKCEVLADISNASCALGIGATYGFLWLRQRTIYTHQIIRGITKRWIDVLSRFSILIMILGTCIFVFFYVIPPSYESNGHFCIGMKIENMPANFRKWATVKRYAVGSAMLFYQILTLLLFVYPMIRCKLANKKSNNSSHDIIHETIRRSLITAIVAVLSDIVALLILGVLPWGSPLLVTDVVYNISCFINACCIVLSFRNPRNIFFFTIKKILAAVPENSQIQITMK